MRLQTTTKENSNNSQESFAVGSPLRQTGFSGLDNGLGAVGHLKLGEDVGHVVAHGFRTEAQPDIALVVFCKRHHAFG